MSFSSPTDMSRHDPEKLNAAIIGPNHLFPFDSLGTQSSRASAPPSRDKITPCPMKSHLVHHPSLRDPRGLPEISQGIFHAFSPTFPTYCRLIQRGHATNFSQRDCDVYFSQKLTTCTQGWRSNRISENTSDDCNLTPSDNVIAE